jgi:type II secretion system protein H
VGALAELARAPGRASRTGAGFTLVELLVVLAVLGIAAALVTANLAGDDRGTGAREARRLAGALEHATAAAQWRRETLGVSAEGERYRFWRRDEAERWVQLADDEVLAPRALPAGLSVAPARYAGAPAPADAVIPLRPSGRNEPFALALHAPGWVFTLAADPLNRIATTAASR